MSCDHKWGDGPNEYSKTKTEIWPRLGRISICDMCKEAIGYGKVLYDSDNMVQYILNKNGTVVDGLQWIPLQSDGPGVYLVEEHIQEKHVGNFVSVKKIFKEKLSAIVYIHNLGFEINYKDTQSKTKQDPEDKHRSVFFTINHREID